MKVVLGFFGLLFPSAVSRVLGIQPDGPLGISELRATYGGFFLCLGIWCFAARVLSMAIDASRSWQNVVGILFEASVGGAMLAARL